MKLSIVRKQETIDEAKGLGAKDYIVKPIDEVKLISSIKKLTKNRDG